MTSMLYLDWMSAIAFHDSSERSQYQSLLHHLHSIPFYFLIPMDENRMVDGIDLRYRFAHDHSLNPEDTMSELGQNNSCSVLEMMVALALKGDERVLYDYETGSKSDYIFKAMLASSQLTDSRNDRFSPEYVSYRVDCILKREYEYDGFGGLFTVNNPRMDMRDVDIWYQMNWYLQTLYDD